MKNKTENGKNIIIKTNKGVTIIALIVTIIVLLILAGVSIHKILSDNGVLSKTEDASDQTKLMKVLEDAKMAYKDCYEEKDEDIELGSTVTTADVAAKLINKYGYKSGDITTIINPDDISDIKVNKSNIIIAPGNSEIVTIIPIEGLTLSYIKINEEYYPLEIKNEIVTLGRPISNLPLGNSNINLSVVSSDESKVKTEIDTTNSMNVKLTGLLETSEPIKVIATYGGKTAEINVTVSNSTYIVTVKVANEHKGRGTAGIPGETIETKEYGSGTRLNLVANASTGYGFDGWYIDNLKISGAGANYVYTVDKNAVITARFIPLTYTISYIDNGGSVSLGNKTASYTIESNAITLPTMAKTGYTFLGWTGSNGNTPQTSVTIPRGSYGDKSYTANWAINVYMITYDDNGGTIASGVKTTSYTVESNTITLPTMQKVAYDRFIGWTDNNTVLSIKTGSEIPFQPSSSWNCYYGPYLKNLDIGYYRIDIYGTGLDKARFRVYEYETTNANLISTQIISSTHVVLIGEVVNKLNKDGLEVLVYKDASDVTVSKEEIRKINTNQTIPKGSIGNKSYTANYASPTVYSINYDLHGGSVSANPTTYTIESSSITLNKPSKTKYTFVGWTRSNGVTPQQTVTIPRGSTGNKYYIANFTETYEKLEFIESAGNQYIDTGITPDETTNIEVTFKTTSSKMDYQRIYGQPSEAGNQRYQVEMNMSNIASWWPSVGGTRYNGITIDAQSQFRTIKFVSGTGWYVDGTLVTSSTLTEKNSYNIWLFKGYDRTASYLQISGCKIWKGGTLVRYLVPCYRKSDGVIGMYDSANGKFYTNAGTGSFKREIDTSLYQKLEYIESAGNGYIDTGVTPDETTNIEVSFSISNNTLDFQRIYGQPPEATNQRYQVEMSNSSLTAWWPSIGGTRYGITLDAQSKFRILKFVSGTGWYIDGVLALSSTLTETNNYSIWLFKGYDRTGSYMEIGNAKIWNNGSLVRNFIPCYRKSDGAIGMYDNVNGVFYANAGTATFLKGPTAN